MEIITVQYIFHDSKFGAISTASISGCKWYAKDEIKLFILAQQKLASHPQPPSNQMLGWINTTAQISLKAGKLLFIQATCNLHKVCCSFNPEARSLQNKGRGKLATGKIKVVLNSIQLLLTLQFGNFQ